jgi:hypothetical protein
MLCRVATQAQNKVMRFDGVNKHVDLGGSVARGIRTIEIWFNLEAAINAQALNYSPLIVRDETTNADEFGLTFLHSSTSNSGELLFYLFTGSNTSYRLYSNSNNWNANQWYRIAAVIHPSQGMMLFIDGIKQNSTSSFLFPTIIPSSSTLIGSCGSSVLFYFNGSIDNLRFSNTDLYSSNFTPSYPGLVALSSTIGV